MRILLLDRRLGLVGCHFGGQLVVSQPPNRHPTNARMVLSTPRVPILRVPNPFLAFVWPKTMVHGFVLVLG